MDEAVTLLTFIRQVSTSNLGRNTDPPPKMFCDSSLFRQHGMNIGSRGAELLHSDRRTDGHDKVSSRFLKIIESN
jgi:hypothetical protein